MLSTRTKIRFARILSRGLGVARRIARRPPGPVMATRSGCRYELDPAEGIDLAVLLGIYERGTSRALRRLVRPGDVVIDVGANIGAHTLPLAKAVQPSGRVLAVEPTDFAFAKLERNLALNPMLAQRVSAFHSYLDDGVRPSDKPSFYASWRLETLPNQHDQHMGTLAPASGEGRTLDSLLNDLDKPPAAVIKLDVDGNECRVLRGAGETLRRLRPTIVLELCPYALAEQGDSLAVLLQLLADAGYCLYDERRFAPLPVDPTTLARHIPAGGSINAVAAVPGGLRDSALT